MVKLYTDNASAFIGLDLDGKKRDISGVYSTWLMPFTGGGRCCPNIRGDRVCGCNLTFRHGPTIVHVYNTEADWGQEKVSLVARMTATCRLADKTGKGTGRRGCGATVCAHGYFPNAEKHDNSTPDVGVQIDDRVVFKIMCH